MKPEPITIRPLEHFDPARISAEFESIGWLKSHELFERYLAEQQDGHRLVCIAMISEAFAGFATLNWHPSYPPFRDAGIPEVQDLNVLPRFRRRGVGSALMQAAEDAARARVATIGIGVGLTADYGAAQQLYVRRGYLPNGLGVAYRNLSVSYGERVTVDDDLVLYFTKCLSR